MILLGSIAHRKYIILRDFYMGILLQVVSRIRRDRYAMHRRQSRSSTNRLCAGGFMVKKGWAKVYHQYAQAESQFSRVREYTQSVLVLYQKQNTSGIPKLGEDHFGMLLRLN